MLAETVEGARTVEALGLEQRPGRGAWTPTIAALVRGGARTLFLRTVWFPTIEFGYLVPTVGTLLVGGWLHAARPGRPSAR